MASRRLALVVPLLAVAVLTGCGDDGSSDVAADRSSAARSTSSPARTSESPAAATSPSPAAVTTPSSAPPEWPAAATPTHGARLWGAYLVVADYPDPSLSATEERVRALGYGGGMGALGCDQGAAEALGADPDAMTVAVYFDDRGSADQFLALYDGPSVGIAEVTMYCLD
jgi:hypothetical protein